MKIGKRKIISDSFALRKQKDDTNNIGQIINQTFFRRIFPMQKQTESKIDMTTQWDPDVNDKSTHKKALEESTFPMEGWFVLASRCNIMCTDELINRTELLPNCNQEWLMVGTKKLIIMTSSLMQRK